MWVGEKKKKKTEEDFDIRLMKLEVSAGEIKIYKS